jgi:hypothetical protein
MPDEKSDINFQIPSRQKRLRALMGILLLTTIVMIILGLTLPIFHIPPADTIPMEMRHAYLRKVILILSWWALCMIITFSIFLLAWFDLKSVQIRMRMAQRDFWRKVASENKESTDER